MRKTIPALMFTSIFALASGSAFALGDRNKEKKSTDGATATTSQSATKSQAAQNDARCDESKYASRSAMPKECLDKSGTGASSVSSTQGQSGGSSGASGAGASGPAGSSSSGSASSGGTGSK
jgi:hypothetical protein